MRRKLGISFVILCILLSGMPGLGTSYAGRVVGTIPVSEQINGLAYNPLSDQVIIDRVNGIHVYNAQTYALQHSFLGSLTVVDAVYGEVISVERPFLNGTLIVRDANNITDIKDQVILPESQEVTHIQADPARRHVYIANKNNIIMLDGNNSYSFMKRIMLPRKPYRLAVDWIHEKIYYTTTTDQAVFQRDMQTGAEFELYGMGQPWRIAFNPANQTVYASLMMTKGVFYYNTNTGDNGLIPLQDYGYELEIDEAANKVYVEIGGKLAVIDGGTHEVQTLNVGVNFDFIGIDSRNQILYLAKQPNSPSENPSNYIKKYDLTASGDGEGSITVSPSEAVGGQSDVNFTFNYTPSGKMADGALQIELPSGWTAPSTTPGAAGYIYADYGRVTVSGRTVTIDGLNLQANQTVTISYQKVNVGTADGKAVLPVQQKGIASGTMQALAASPEVFVRLVKPVAEPVSVQTPMGQAVTITLRATHPASGQVVFESVELPKKGRLGTIAPSVCEGGYCTATVTYTPDSNTIDSDSFMYRSGYGGLYSEPAAVTVQINPLHAHRVSVDTGVLNPIAGEPAAITLTVLKSDASVDKMFSGMHNVTLSGVTAAPDGTYGRFGGTELSGTEATVSVMFTDGTAVVPLELHRAGTQQVAFRVAGVTEPQAGTLELTPVAAAPGSLELTQQPQGPVEAGGGELTTQPIVRVVDAYGNTAPSPAVTVTASVGRDSGEWMLSGPTAVEAEDGIVRFAGLSAVNASLTADVTAAKVSFAAPGLPAIASEPFAVARAIAEAHTVEASAASLAPVAGAATDMTLTVRKSDGSVDTAFSGEHDVTLNGVTAAPDGTYGRVGGKELSGTEATVSVTFTDGTAVVPLELHHAGTQQVAFRVAGVTEPQANALELTPVAAAPTSLELTQQPQGSTEAGGGELTAQPIVRVVDAYGNTAPSPAVTVTASVARDSGEWTLSGPTAVEAEDGIVRFAGLSAANASLTADVTAAKVSFAAPGLPAIASEPFAVARAIAEAHTVEAAAASVSPVAGAATDMTLTVRKSDGSVDTAFSGEHDVTLNGVTAAPDGTYGRVGGKELSGTEATVSVTFTDGTAVVPLELRHAGTQQVAFRVGGVTKPQANALELTPVAAAPSSLELTQQPQGPVEAGGGELTAQPIVRVVDVYGNTALSSAVKVTASVAADSGDWMLSGQTEMLTENGLAAFAGLKAETQNRTVDVVTAVISFAGEELAGAASEPFSIKKKPYDPGSGGTGGGGGGGGGGSTWTSSSKTPVTPPVEDKEDKKDEPEDNSKPTPRKLFADMHNHWAEADVMRLVEMGVIDGYPDGTFRPSREVTRAEFTVLLARALGLAPQEGLNEFADIERHWAKSYIDRASAQGLIGGYTDSRFGPDDKLSREQMATIIARALQQKYGPESIPGSDQNQTAYTDEAEIASWAVSAVHYAAEQGILSGYPNGSFKPKAATTRAELAAVITRFLDRLAGK